MQLQGISSMATRALLAALVAEFEKTSVHRVQIESVGGVDAAKRVAAGEMLDLVVLGSDAIDKLVQGGHVQPGSRVDLVQSPIAVAIKKGAPRAAITPASSLKDSIVAAKSISYSTGPSGVYLAGLFEKMGIAEKVKAKTIVPSPGIPVGSLVAKGEADIGFQQLSELMNIEGIEVLGTLPDEVAYITIFSAAIPKQASPQALVVTQEFLRFCNSAQSTALKHAQGMTPAMN